MIFESSGRISSALPTNWEATPGQQLSVLISHEGTIYDYTKAVLATTVQKVQKLANISTLNFSVSAIEVFGLPAPSRGDYVTFTTAEYGQWFTGYITVEPTQTISGVNQFGAKCWQYDVAANSDEWILNLQMMPVGLVYQNTTSGAILQDLAERLLPGMFNYDNIQAGPVVAKYIVDPQRIFTDVVNDLAGNAFYNFYSQGKNLYFYPIDQTPQNIIIDGNDANFTPSALQITASTDTIINDVTVVGMVEPQGKMTEYWVGDGITGKFNLTSGVYGVAEETLLDETFSNSIIDTSVWTVYDSPIGFLQVSNGYLNCLGGYADGSYGVQVISNDLFPLENNIRITHGQWDFVSKSVGILGGIYFDLPQAPVAGVFPNILYGIQVSASPFSVATVLNPIVNGVPDPSQTLAVTDYFNTRVACRTILTFTNPVRTFHEYGYIATDGTVGSNTAPLAPDTVTISTFLALIDINTGAILQSRNWINTTTVTAEQTYAYYAPVVSDNLNITVTGITISRPIQASLAVKSLRFPTYNLYAAGGDIKFSSDRGYFIGQTLQPTDDFTLTARIDTITNLNTGNQRAGLMYRYRWDTQPNPVYTYGDDAMVSVLISAAGVASMRVRDGLNSPVVELGVLDENNGQTDGITLPQYLMLAKVGNVFTGSYSSDGEAWTVLTTHTYSPVTTSGPMVAGLVVTGEEYNTVEQVSAEFQEVKFNNAAIVVDTRAELGTVLVSTWPQGYSTDTSNWTTQQLGVNELDTLDGLAPEATIIEQSQSVQKNENLRGSFQYNPGQCQLDYFSDATTQTLDVPDIGDLIRTTYSRAGTAIARVVNQDSVDQEATSFGDTGHRQTTVINLSPLPRTSDECSAAAAATIQSSGYQHFEGTYTQYDSFGMIGEPKAGAVLPFVNLSADMPGLTSEIIQGVTSTLLSIHPQENYQHAVQFGLVNTAQEYVNRLGIPEGAPMPNDIADVPKQVDLTLFDESVLQPLSSVELTAWDETTWTFTVNDTLNAGEGIEVRSTDDSWGSDPGRNLVYRNLGGGSFQTPRTINGRLVFLRRFDYRNFVPFSEDLTQWTPSAVTIVNSKQLNPDNAVSLVSTATAAQGGTLGVNLSFPAQTTNPTVIPRVVSTLSTPNSSLLDPSSTLSNTHTAPVKYSAPVPTTYKVPVTVPVTGVSISCAINGPVGTEIQVDLLIEFPIGWGVDGYGASLYGAEPDMSSENPSTAVTLGAGWTPFEWDNLTLPVGASGATLQFTFLTPGIISITRVQVEPRSTTTLYCKTTGGPYGALSRYSYGVRANLPLIPPPPTGSVDITDPLNPVITLTLPADETNVWAYEIRDQDNKTVLMSAQYGQSNFGAGYNMTFTYANNTSRNRSFFLYTINLLNEYSPAFVLDMVIPSPVISAIAFDDTTLSLMWDSTAAVSFEVIVQKIIETLRPPGLQSPEVVAGASTFTSQVIGTPTVGVKKSPGASTAIFNTTAEMVKLVADDYFNERFITIIPYDNLGAGTAVTIDHIYAPPAVNDFSLNEILVVAAPAGPRTNPISAPITDPIRVIYVAESWRNYYINQGILPPE
jgi:hypothetical protein